MNLGAAVVQLDAAGTALSGSQHTHVFQVQEFRRPEFEVKAQASEGPHVVGGAATVAVSAAYYAGGALPGAEVTLARERDRGTLPSPEPGRLRLRDVRALVGARTGTGRAGAGGDDERAHRRLGCPPPADRLRPRRSAAAAGRPRRGHGHGREPAGVDCRGGPPRPPVGALRGPAHGAGLRAEGRAHRDRRDRHRPRGPRDRGRCGALARGAARLGAGRGRVEGGPEGRAGADARVRGRARARALRGEGGRSLARRGPGGGRARAARTRRSCGSGWPAAACPLGGASRKRRSRSSPTGRSTGRATWRRSWCWRPSLPRRGS